MQSPDTEIMDSLMTSLIILWTSINESCPNVWRWELRQYWGFSYKEPKERDKRPSNDATIVWGRIFSYLAFSIPYSQSSSNKYIYRVKSKHRYMKIEFQLGFRIFFTLSYCSVCALVKESPQFLSSTKRHGMVFYGQIVVSFIMLKDYSLPFLSQ